MSKGKTNERRRSNTESPRGEAISLVCQTFEMMRKGWVPCTSKLIVRSRFSGPIWGKVWFPAHLLVHGKGWYNTILDIPRIGLTGPCSFCKLVCLLEHNHWKQRRRGQRFDELNSSACWLPYQADPFQQIPVLQAQKISTEETVWFVFLRVIRTIEYAIAIG